MFRLNLIVKFLHDSKVNIKIIINIYIKMGKLKCENYKICFLISIVLLICVKGSVSECNPDTPTIHYEEFGCTPVAGNDGCPVAYSCDEMIRKIRIGFCVFDGRALKTGEIVDEEMTRTCLRCSCEKTEGNKSFFSCMTAMCLYRPLELGCHIDEQLGRCCHNNTVCAPFTDAQVCRVHGQAHFQGQSFYLYNSCQRCICKKSSDGKRVEPACERLKCDLPLYYSEELMNYCVPVYRRESICCPYNWECELKGKYNHVGTPFRGTLANNMCRFGSRMMQIGTKFDLRQDLHEELEEGQKIACECRIPPLVTCYLIYIPVPIVNATVPLGNATGSTILT